MRTVTTSIGIINLLGEEILKINHCILKPKAAGEEGKIYHYQNSAIKIYHDFPRKSVISSEFILFLSKLKTNRIVLPSEPLVDKDTGKTLGYIMPFISGNQEEIFTYHKGKLIKEMELLKSDLTVLGENHVVIGDLRFSNFLSNKDGIYLLDAGDYYHSYTLSNTTSNNIANFNNYIVDDFLYYQLKQLENYDTCKRIQGLYRKERYNVRTNYSFVGDYFEEKMEEEETLVDYAKRLIKSNN